MLRSRFLVATALLLTYFVATGYSASVGMEANEKQSDAVEEPTLIQGVGSIQDQILPGSQQEGMLVKGFKNIVEQVRNFDVREMFTQVLRRMTSFLAPQQTLAQGRDGRMIFNPELDKILRRAVDIMFDYAETYFSN